MSLIAKYGEETIHSADDHIQVDLALRNEDLVDEFKPAVYSATKPQSFVDVPRLYHLFVSKFAIDSANLPVYIWDPAAPPVVQVTYNGDIQQAAAVYVPWNSYQTTDARYYWVESPQHMVQMINTALATAFGNLAAPPAGSTAPFIRYSPDTQKFTFYGLKAFYDLALALPIEVAFNSKLHTLFYQWSYSTDANLAFQLLRLYDENGLNTVAITGSDYITATDNASVASAWCPIKTIEFRSQTLPIRPVFGDDGGAQTNSRESILTSFTVDPPSVFAQKGAITFIPSTDVGKIDLIGDTPLRSLDITIFAKDGEGNQFPFGLYYRSRIFLRMLFVKKGSDSL